MQKLKVTVPISHSILQKTKIRHAWEKRCQMHLNNLLRKKAYLRNAKKADGGRRSQYVSAISKLLKSNFTNSCVNNAACGKIETQNDQSALISIGYTPGKTLGCNCWSRTFHNLTEWIDSVILTSKNGKWQNYSLHSMPKREIPS